MTLCVTGHGFSAAAERNKLPILEILIDRLHAGQRVLEIGSGSGQHAMFLAQSIQDIYWQPSDRKSNLAALRKQLLPFIDDHLLQPLALDVEQADWPAVSYDAVFAANVAHIMSWPMVESMVAGVAGVLIPGGHWFLYGPFHRDGEPTSIGNANFDRDLRAANQGNSEGQGIRNDQSIIACATGNNLKWVEDIAMPANNRILVFSKSTDNTI